MNLQSGKDCTIVYDRADDTLKSLYSYDKATNQLVST